MGFRVFIYILIDGAVYFSQLGGIEDDAMLERLSKRFASTSRDSTFQILYKQCASDWLLQSDVTYPFNDARGVTVETVWTFDLENDVLRFDKKNDCRQIPLRHFRDGSTDTSKFTPYEQPRNNSASVLECRSQDKVGSEVSTIRPLIVPPYLDIGEVKLNATVSERRRIFLSRLLRDFGFQWRHILVSHYNYTTFRKFASAIIRLATCSFEVVEIDYKRRGNGGFRVHVHNVPSWRPLPDDIMTFGRVHVIVSKHLRHAVTMAHTHHSNEACRKTARSNARLFDDVENDGLYLILSVKEVVLYSINDEREMFSRPEPLFNGTDAPSPEAIELLLAVLNRPAYVTRLQAIPMELQDIVLDNVSVGPIERARMGCVLETGTKFLWKNGDRDISLENGHTHRMEGTPVESEIFFGGSFSGIVYK